MYLRLLQRSAEVVESPFSRIVVLKCEAHMRSFFTAVAITIVFAIGFAFVLNFIQQTSEIKFTTESVNL